MIIKEDIYTTVAKRVLENGTVIYSNTHIVAGSEIGANCMIGERCYVGGEGAIIGDNVKIQNGNDIWRGVTIEDDVFIGPKCNLTNDHDPSVKQGMFIPDKTTISEGTTLGTNVTIIAPCFIGAYSSIGAASVILRDILDGERVAGVVK